MSRPPPLIRKRDLHNMLAAVVAAGAHIARVEVAADGAITITTTNAETINSANPEEELLKAIDARKNTLPNKAR
jgi:hypothetical protein